MQRKTRPGKGRNPDEPHKVGQENPDTERQEVQVPRKRTCKNPQNKPVWWDWGSGSLEAGGSSGLLIGGHKPRCNLTAEENMGYLCTLLLIMPQFKKKEKGKQDCQTSSLLILRGQPIQSF